MALSDEGLYIFSGEPNLPSGQTMEPDLPLIPKPRNGSSRKQQGSGHITLIQEVDRGGRCDVRSFLGHN
jgi:hypothetical protein